jgi:hypothetical protein
MLAVNESDVQWSQQQQTRPRLVPGVRFLDVTSCVIWVYCIGCSDTNEKINYRIRQ